MKGSRMANVYRKSILILAIAAFCGRTAPAQSVPLVGDAFFATGTSNFGSNPTVNVGGSNGFQGLLQFDLSFLPPLATAGNISNATLRLYVNRVGVAGSIDVLAASAPWTELTVSGSNAPAAGALIAGSINVSTPNTYISIPVTSQVIAWLSGSPNHGFLLRAFPTSTSVFFDSKESNPTSGGTSHPAVLEINLNGTPGATGATGPQGPRGPAGALGSRGATGFAGGARGPSGSTGNLGAAGAAGVTGPTGFTGSTGSIGPTGSTGNLGAAGLGGVTGVTGVTGATGAIGPKGSTGNLGAAGPPGPIGRTGPIGPTGLRGSAGAPGQTGSTGPAGSTGAVGPTGPQGALGAQGVAGATGATGPQGLIRNSFTNDAIVLPMSLTLAAGQAPMPADSTNNFYLVNNHPPCTINPAQPGFSNVERAITLPTANVAGKEITLIGVDFTVNGCFLAIYPKAGEKIIFQDHVRPGETGAFDGSAVITGFGARLVSNGAGIWYGIAFN